MFSVRGAVCRLVAGRGSLALCAREGHARALSSAGATSLNIGGVYPPIATSFNKDESISWDKLASNIEKWNKIDFRGYVVQGSNGEYVYLDPEERVEMVKRVRDMADKDKLIIAGSGCESTRQTIKMTEEMAKAGADAVMVVTPCFYKASMTPAAMKHHFTKVADASPVPVILYSVPSNTIIELDADVIIALSHHPNVIGLKDSGGDISRIGNLVYKTQKTGFQILAGSAGFLYPALSVGCVGGVCALSNILGAETVELMKLHAAGKHDEARELQHRLIAPNAAVTKMFGVPGLKVAMEWKGYHGGILRSPLQPLSEPQRDKLRKVFESSGFL